MQCLACHPQPVDWEADVHAVQHSKSGHGRSPDTGTARLAAICDFSSMTFICKLKTQGLIVFLQEAAPMIVLDCGY